MWYAAFYNDRVFLAMLLIFAGVSDWLDGFVARLFKTESEFGAKLDVFADSVQMISTPVLLYWVLPEVYHNHLVLVWGTVVLFTIAFVWGFLKFGRFIEVHFKVMLERGPKKLRNILKMHIQANRIRAVLLYPVLIYLLLGGYQPWLVYVAVAIISTMMLQELALLFYYDRLVPKSFNTRV